MAGIPNVPQDPVLGGGLNTQSVTGFSQFGTQSSALQFTNPTQANPKVNYTWAKGKHSLKVGYEYGWLAQAISDFHPKPIFGVAKERLKLPRTEQETELEASNSRGAQKAEIVESPRRSFIIQASRLVYRSCKEIERKNPNRAEQHRTVPSACELFRRRCKEG